MWKLLTLCAALSCVLVDSANDMGPGKWNIKYINKCEEDSHKFKFAITITRINRTHDGFDAIFTLEEEFTDSYAIRVDVCKEVDGGCKPYQVISENSFAQFAAKYAAENMRTAFEMAGIDPPEFPLPAATYELHDFIFDTEELPTDGPYGEYMARVFMLKGTEEVGCVEVFAEFLEDEEK